MGTQFHNITPCFHRACPVHDTGDGVWIPAGVYPVHRYGAEMTGNDISYFAFDTLRSCRRVVKSAAHFHNGMRLTEMTDNMVIERLSVQLNSSEVFAKPRILP